MNGATPKRGSAKAGTDFFPGPACFDM